jgi:hypothetical protein
MKAKVCQEGISCCSRGMDKVFNILFFEKISENVEFGPEN